MATCPTCHSPPLRVMVSTAETRPAAIVTDHHQPYVRAARQNLPGSLHIRTGLHRLTGETTKPIERSHITTRDRLRASRGLKTTATGQHILVHGITTRI